MQMQMTHKVVFRVQRGGRVLPRGRVVRGRPVPPRARRHGPIAAAARGGDINGARLQRLAAFGRHRGHVGDSAGQVCGGLSSSCGVVTKQIIARVCIDVLARRVGCGAEKWTVGRRETGGNGKRAIDEEERGLQTVIMREIFLCEKERPPGCAFWLVRPRGVRHIVSKRPLHGGAQAGQWQAGRRAWQARGCDAETCFIKQDRRRARLAACGLRHGRESRRAVRWRWRWRPVSLAAGGALISPSGERQRPLPCSAQSRCQRAPCRLCAALALLLRGGRWAAGRPRKNAAAAKREWACEAISRSGQPNGRSRRPRVEQRRQAVLCASARRGSDVAPEGRTAWQDAEGRRGVEESPFISEPRQALRRRLWSDASPASNTIASRAAHACADRPLSPPLDRLFAAF
jgi:hypothetical protein